MEGYKLISSTSFVLEQFDLLYKAKITQDQYVTRTKKYCNFLSQPLKLEMFVPCDDEGNVMKEPKKYDSKYDKINAVGNIGFNYPLLDKDLMKYQQAKEKVLFEGFELIEISKDLKIIKNRKKDCQVLANQYQNHYYNCVNFETVEDLIKHDIQLTESAKKQIGV